MESERYLPEKVNRNTIVDPPVGTVGVQTYNGFNQDENIESLKIAIRRNLPTDAMFRCLESLRTNSECGHELVREMLLTASIDVGPANPSLVLMIDDLIGRDMFIPDFDNVLIAVELLSNSPKCRLFGWIYDFYAAAKVEQRSEIVENSLTSSIVFIETYLSDDLFEKVIEEAAKVCELICHVDKELWKRLCNLCQNPSRAKYLSKASATFWIPVLARAERCGSQTVCNVVHRLYDIASSRSLQSKISLREDRRVFAMWSHAVWVLCNIKSVEETHYEQGHIRLISGVSFKSDQERLQLIRNHRSREFLIGALPCAVNMFTQRGKQEGKNRDHYIKECAVLIGEFPEYAAESKKWLTK